MTRFTHFCSVGIIIGLLTLGGTWLYEKRIEAANIGLAASQTLYPIDETELHNTIQAILVQNQKLDMSVTIIDLQTHKRYHWGDTASYTAASIGKLITATAFLHNVELGKASLTDKVGQLDAQTQLTKLITKSDNTAWQQLNSAITKEGLESYARSLSLNTYNSVDNTMTSDDIALLLEKLASQRLLSTKHNELLLSLMQQADMRNYIVAAIPAGTDVYHKVGYLADRLHDAAIIKRGDRSYVLAIFSKSSGAYDFYHGSRVFGEITRASLQAFFNTTP